MKKDCKTSIVSLEACGECDSCISQSMKVIKNYKAIPFNELNSKQQISVRMAALYLTKFLGNDDFKKFVRGPT